MKLMNKLSFFDDTLLRFLVTGVVNTLVGASVMFLLYNVWECSYWFSSACNYCAGGIVAYFMNKYFTFKNTKKSLRQVILFVFNLLFCFFISYIVAKKLVYFLCAALSDKVKGNIALLVGMCSYTALNYIMQRYFVFQKSEEA